MYRTRHPTKKPLIPASLKTEVTVLCRLLVGFTFCIIVFIASKGITHITLKREIKKEPKSKYFEGIFWSAGIS
jgi:hypothetical protein